MYDVVALGELLIDFVQNGENQKGNPTYEANPGGAPCNVLAMLRKLGYKTAFIGKVGDDSFGSMLTAVLEELDIDISGVINDKEIPTTLAVVHNKSDGDREFSFYRNPGADMMLEEKEVNYEVIKRGRIFHFGSLSMTSEPVHTATKKALAYAKNEKKIISFDPNLRIPLWKNLKEAANAIWYGIENCHILKIADNELQWLTGETDIDTGIQVIKNKTDIPLICVTLGKKGSIAYYEDKKIYASAFVNTQTVDTTGAGDTFCACVLGSILEYGLKGLSEQKIYHMLCRANAAASIVTSQKGALCSMPEIEEIGFLLENDGMERKYE